MNYYLLLKYRPLKSVNGAIINTMDVHQQHLVEHRQVTWALSGGVDDYPQNINKPLMSKYEEKKVDKIFLIEAIDSPQDIRKLYVANVVSVLNRHQFTTKTGGSTDSSRGKNNEDSLSESIIPNVTDSFVKDVPKVYRHDDNVTLNDTRAFFILNGIQEISNPLIWVSSMYLESGNKIPLDKTRSSNIVHFKSEFNIESKFTELRLKNELDLDDTIDEIDDADDIDNTDDSKSLDFETPNKQILCHSIRGTTIKRSKKLSSKALVDANHSCEYCSSNQHIFNKLTRNHKNIPYTEAHHLVPVGYYTEYSEDVSPDHSANIISMCCYCHRVIHLGLPDTQKDMISKLSTDRFKKLVECKLVNDNETLEEFTNRLFEYYGI